jgi:type IV pilus assembly protein PilC
VLEQALDRTADQLEKDDNLRRQVKGAMTYPAVVLTFALGVLLALIAFIVPVFVGIFKDFGGKLPFITQVTVNLSNLVTQRWYILLFGSIALVVGFRKWKKSEWGRPQWDRFRLRVPVNIGKTVQKIALARWSRTFSALYAAGVPIMQAIEVTGKTAGNTVVERAMDDVIASVKSGGSISARCARPRSSPAWSSRCSPSARRPATWTRCSPRSPTSTRTRSPRPSRP